MHATDEAAFEANEDRVDEEAMNLAGNKEVSHGGTEPGANLF
jgi:hypothetical protein